MSDKELNSIIDRSEDEYQKLKDKVVEQALEIEKLNNIINELENEINIAIKELQPNELVNGINLLKNIKITLQELKGSGVNE